MFFNYLKTTARNLLKYKGFSFINVLGLAFGVAACLLILLFVQDELSYDRYHEKADRIYRSGFDAFLNNNATKAALSCAPLAASLMSDFPEVESATRVRNYGSPVFRYGEKVFSEDKVFWADSTFFDVFTVPFLKGDSKTALNKPATIVLTRSMALKYFGDENPIGKFLNADNRRDYLITGVVEDVPENSHFHYDFLASIITYPVGRDVSWLSNNYYTYFVIREGASPVELAKKINEKLSEHAGAEIQQALGITMEQFMKGGGLYRYFLQKLTDIHLHSHLEFEIEPNGNYAYVLFFSIVAIVIASLGLFGLAAFIAEQRTKEIGVRKVLGATISGIIFLLTKQFTKWVIVANILAWPAAYFIMGKWLQNFAYQAPFSVSVFIFSALIALVIAILTVSYQSIRAALANPVDSLRYE